MSAIKDTDLNAIPCTPRISQGFEQLAALLEADSESTNMDFDVVIIGSGYGGAMAAAHLANQCHANGDPVSVCILERGSEYLPGMFPSREADLAGHIRFSREQAKQPDGLREGLFDIRIGNGINVVLGNGLGGGSLINASNIEHKHIIPEPQFSALNAWIKTNKNSDGKPMFISSAAILLPRHTLSITDNNTSAIHSDSWDGYPASLHQLLALLADEEINNVIFLSGDEHLAAVARIRIRNIDTGRQAVTHSIHSSSLHAPFPFANGQPEQLRNEDSFSFHYGDNDNQSSNHYQCSVSTELVKTGDGFTLLRAGKKQGQWQLECTFDREPCSNTINKPITIVL